MPIFHPSRECFSSSDYGTPCLQAFACTPRLPLPLPQISPSCYSQLAQTAAISSPLAPIDLPQRWHKNFPHQIDSFLQHWTTNHVSVYLLLFLITLDLPYILTHIHQPILILEGILSYVNLESENADFCCCDLLAPPPLSLVDFSFYCLSRSRRRSVW